jgi:hypothetical protein
MPVRGTCLQEHICENGRNRFIFVLGCVAWAVGVSVDGEAAEKVQDLPPLLSNVPLSPSSPSLMTRKGKGATRWIRIGSGGYLV